MQTPSDWNKGYAFALLTGALVLLGLCTADLDGHLLLLTAPAQPATSTGGAAVDRYPALFTTDAFKALLQPAGRRDVFFTAHFNKPAPPPAEPAKPTTRWAALTYLGTLGATPGAPAVFVRVDQRVLKLAAGGRVIEDWGIAEISSSALVLTNTAAKTHRLAFKQTFQLEVPIR